MFRASLFLSMTLQASLQAASTSAPRARSKAEELMQRELAAKRGREERANGGGGGGRKDAPWLQTGIIVKVRSAPRQASKRLCV